MKIAPSIKIYVLLSVLLTGSGIIWGLSILSSNYFISGMDIATRNSMLAFAHQQQSDYQITFDAPQEKSVQSQKKTISYGFVKNWDDVPLIFKQTYQPQDLILNQFYKHIENTSWLTPPKTGSFLIKVIKDGQIYYVTHTISNDNAQINSISDLNNFVIISLTALGVIALFALILLLVMRKVTLPVIRLKNWAKQLSNKQLSQETPDFHYRELNLLADIIRNSLSSVQESIEREQKFLGYASHELRTPIAVSHSNSELLKKLIESHAPAEKQLKVLDRILRANLTMTGLTETLLWLNRDEDKQLTYQNFKLGELTEQLVTELKYLTIDKNITLNIETDNSTCELPEVVCRIVISNLIRNAFQHTAEGYVTIKQEKCQLSIINQNNPDKDTASLLQSNNLGFGLGLSLTERIVQQYQWQYDTQEIAGGKNVSVTFESR